MCTVYIYIHKVHPNWYNTRSSVARKWSRILRRFCNNIIIVVNNYLLSHCGGGREKLFGTSYWIKPPKGRILRSDEAYRQGTDIRVTLGPRVGIGWISPRSWGASSTPLGYLYSSCSVLLYMLVKPESAQSLTSPKVSPRKNGISRVRAEVKRLFSDCFINLILPWINNQERNQYLQTIFPWPKEVLLIPHRKWVSLPTSVIEVKRRSS